MKSFTISVTFTPTPGDAPRLNEEAVARFAHAALEPIFTRAGLSKLKVVENVVECRSCQMLPVAQRVPATRLVAGQPYCFQHGMDIYCD